MNRNDSSFKQIRRNQEAMQRLVTSLTPTVITAQQISRAILPVAQQMQEMLVNNLKQIDVSPLTRAISDNVYVLSGVGASLNSSLSNVLDSYQSTISNIASIHNQMPVIQNLQSGTMNHLISSIGALDSTFSRVTSIDFSGIEELDLDSLINEPEIQQGSSDMAATIVVAKPEKKVMEMTGSELDTLMKKHISKAGKFSLGAFIFTIFDDYIKEIALLVLEIIFSIMITFATGQFNAEVIEEIGHRIEETDTYRDAKKVITRYVKINPTEQVAFLRKDLFLRESTSKNSPVVSRTKITQKSVLSIIDRKNNWVKVEVNTGDSSGEVGWVQESMVIKFKKVD